MIQTPLIELLERIPQDARLIVEHDQFSSSSHPVGRMCHEAAAELRRLHEVNADLLDALKAQLAVTDWSEQEKANELARAALAKAKGQK